MTLQQSRYALPIEEVIHLELHQNLIPEMHAYRALSGQYLLGAALYCRVAQNIIEP